MHKIITLTYARSLEFFRDKEALAWNLLMPVFFVVGIALAFGHGKKTLYQITVINTPAQQSLMLPKLSYIEYVNVDNLADAKKKLEQHQTDLIIAPGQPHTYWYNPLSEKSDFLNQLYANLYADQFTAQKLESAKIRYIDWVFPGILALNVMYGALYGIAYVIVRYRKNGYLKRLQATPLTAFEFISAQILARFIISTTMLIIINICCVLLLNPIMKGSWFTLLTVYMLGILCIISLALLVCSRITSEELTRGLLEMLAWPMLIFSGAWFSLDQVHVSIRWIAESLPLTHLIRAAREVMLYGAGIQEIQRSLLILAAMTVCFLLISSWRFKWRP